MKCPKCNMKLEKDDMFCPNCGTLLSAKKDKGGKQWVAVLCAVVMVIVIGTAIAMYLLSGEKASDTIPNQGQKETDIAGGKESSEELKKENEEDGNKEEQQEEDQNEEKKPATLALTAKPASLSPYYKLSVGMSSASSVIEQKGYDNSADMVLDGKDATSWQEGVTGPGIGENLTFSFDKAYRMKYMSFKLGNWRGDDYYIANHRPKTLQIIAGDCEQLVEFPDGKEEYWIEFSKECLASEVKIVIQDVYTGNHESWDDTCIAEIGMYGKE